MPGMCSVPRSWPNFCNPRTVACQALLSMEFSRQEYWSRLSFPRDRIHISWVSCIGRQILYHCTTWEAPALSIVRNILALKILWRYIAYCLLTGFLSHTQIHRLIINSVDWCYNDKRIFNTLVKQLESNVAIRIKDFKNTQTFPFVLF